MEINLANGYKDVVSAHLHNSGEGLVIVRTGTKLSGKDEFVVWYIKREGDNSDFEAYHGHYTLNWDSAVENYVSRVKRALLSN